MSKNTTIFIILLVILAVGAGYGKYVAIPQYWAKNPPLASPTPNPSPTASQVPELHQELQLAADALTPAQKMMQLLSVSIPVPISSNSASVDFFEKNQTGFVTLVGQVSSSSAQKAIQTLQPQATVSALPTMYAFSKTGQDPELCTYDEKCLAILDKLAKPITLSNPIEISTSSAAVATTSTALANVAIAEFENGATVVTLYPKIKQLQLTTLVTQLAARYSSDVTFKKEIDEKLLQLMYLKREYQ